MENESRIQNKERLKKTATIITNILKVVKIILIVGASILVLLSITSAILGVTGAFTKLYEQFPEEFSNIKLTLDNNYYMFVKERNITLGEIYLNGELDLLLYGVAVTLISSAVSAVIFILLIHFAQKVFILMSKNESPFDKSLLVPFRVLFIILTVIIVFKSSVFFGLLVGGLLLCLYFIYSYGCKMQEDEDMIL